MDTFSDAPIVAPKTTIKSKITINGVAIEYEWYIFTLQGCDEQSSLRRIVLDGWEPVSITHTGPLLLALLAKRRT